MPMNTLEVGVPGSASNATVLGSFGQRDFVVSTPSSTTATGLTAGIYIASNRATSPGTSAADSMYLGTTFALNFVNTDPSTVWVRSVGTSATKCYVMWYTP